MRALRLWTATAAIGAGLLWAGSALADAPPPSYPPAYAPVYAPTLTYDWTGVYVGGHIGGANATTKWTYTGSPEDVAQSHNSFVGGGHVGLQKQWSWIVLGAEATYLWMDQQESSVSGSLVDTSLSSNVRNLLLVTGKFGWAWENALGYFKGGYATGDVDFRTTMTSTGALRTSSSGRENGWTAGAGLEYALWNHIIIGVEYDYVKFNVGTRDQAPTALGPAGTQVTGGGVDIQTVMARLSFKFGGARPEPIPTK
jgi:outer membrane immunogenic protein